MFMDKIWDKERGRTLVSSDGSVNIVNILLFIILRSYATGMGTRWLTLGSIKPPVAIWASNKRIPRDSVTYPLLIA